MKTRVPRTALLLVCLAALAPTQLGGQIPRKLKDAAKKAVEAKVQPPPAQPVESKASADAGDAASADESKGAASTDPKVWDNYDFVPGNKVIFFTDFSEDKVGNFARRLKYVSGPMDVVERDGVRMLRAAGNAEFLIPLGGTLPQRFTLEFDFIARNSNCCAGEELRFDGGQGSGHSEPDVAVFWHHQSMSLSGGGQNFGNSTVKIPDAMQEQLRGKLSHIRLLMDGAYFKLYTNERRLYNIPELAFTRDSVIHVYMGGREDDQNAVYLAQIRVAESETDVLYDALAADGRWATQGILFETGKSDLKPESRPVLKEIASTLKEHDDLKVLIEGHTDNVGNAASNLTLSEARAAAVKDALVTDFGIEEDRITTQGFGDSKPAQPNTTPEGRAQNRRVEIVKQ